MKHQTAPSDNAKRPGENASSTQSTNRRLGVLGIGLVMEEIGKGARLVFRYPSAPAPIFYNDQSSQDDRQKSGLEGNFIKKGGRLASAVDDSEIPADSNSIDLFFDLPAKVMSKLFRPKRPLCGQPLTLNVSGTTFCCRAELFDSQPSTVGGGEGSNHPLVLFSVIVALAPLASSGGATISTTQFDRANPTSDTSNAANRKRSDFAFSAIRRVHDNLANLCRVLKREELRCRYVSRQCQMLLQVRREYEAREGPDDDRGGNEVENGVAGSGVDCANKNNNTTNELVSSPKDTRPAPIPPVSTNGKKESNNGRDKESGQNLTQSERREYVQNLVEIMLAANCTNTQPEDSDDDCDRDECKQPLHGNLARELARVFHCLSKDSVVMKPSLVTNSENEMVYINRHISVPIVPLRTNEDSSSQIFEVEVHPYHTLLFPNLKPSEILKELQDEHANPSSLSINRILRQILPIAHPRRSLNEIALDSGIPLPYVMNAATWLVKAKMCNVATPVNRRNRYICVDGIVSKIQSLQLAFWQDFGLKCRRHNFRLADGCCPPHIFVVISTLTTKHSDREGNKLVSSDPPTLGEVIASCGSGYEDIVYSMAVWLVAKNIIVEMK